MNKRPRTEWSSFNKPEVQAKATAARKATYEAGRRTLAAEKAAEKAKQESASNAD